MTRLTRVPLSYLVLSLLVFPWMACGGSFLAAVAQEEQYPVPPEAVRQPNVPEGKLEGPFTLSSSIYPGTKRQYWLYIPSQYDPATPACSMIVQDGLGRAEEWQLPVIFDNLIHSKQMPVTVGIFVSPGIVPAAREGSQPRYNRSFEYDSMGDAYARFLLEELLPDASKTVNLSSNPNDRAVAGASSGGICAFNAAWERPDAFRRVLCTIGTFVGLRGGNEFPMLVRKMESKPLRIFLQDGSNDLNIYAGDWWVANQDMLSALKWAGYDVHHAWGEGGHNGRHAAAIMPDALRWLWRDYPEPIKASPNPTAERRIDLLVPGQDWTLLSSGHQSAEAPTSNAMGELFFSDSKAGRLYRVGDDNKTRVFKDQTGRITSLGFGPDGRLYAVRDNKQIIRFDGEGNEEIVLPDVKCQKLLMLPDGFYFTDEVTPAVHWSTYSGRVMQAASLTEPIVAMIPTADHGFMHAAPRDRQFTWHYVVQEGASLEHRQRFGFLHLPYMERSSGVTAMATDTDGSVFVASNIGIQVLDQLGRVNLILRKPSKDAITGMSFGGPKRDILFVTAGENVYARKLNTRGVCTFETPAVLPRPRL
jgi:gluconolactonase